MANLIPLYLCPQVPGNMHFLRLRTSQLRVVALASYLRGKPREPPFSKILPSGSFVTMVHQYLAVTEATGPEA